MEDRQLLQHVHVAMRRPKANARRGSCPIAKAIVVKLQEVAKMQVPSGRSWSVGNFEPSLFALFIFHVLAFAASSSSSSDTRELVASHFASSFRISSTDLQTRQSLERDIQLAAFVQFDHSKTGRLYDVSVTSVPSGSTFQAIRLRSGSFRRYGVDINEFSIPQGCVVNPFPERIMLVYARLSQSSLFQGLPEGLVLASSVIILFAYDASDLNTTRQLDKLSVAVTGSPISIHFQPLSSGFSNLACAFFEDNSTAVNYSALVQNACTVNHLGTFSLVGIAPVPSPSPAPSPPPSPVARRSNTWKIVVGSVIGGLALLSFMSLFALGVGKRRKKEKFARMQFQADQGETLQTASIRNSRAPAAGGTRTQPTLEKDDDV